MVVGPSSCGKTVFTTKLLVDNPELFETPPKSIYYCYGSWQDGFKRMKPHGIKFHEGIPDSELLPVWFPKGGLLVLDDLMEEGGNDKHSQHQNVTVFYLCHLFSANLPRAFPGTLTTLWVSRTLAINWVCATCCYKPFPPRRQEVQDTFRKVTERPLGYMVLGLHPKGGDDQRILSHLRKEEGCIRCHQLKQDAAE